MSHTRNTVWVFKPITTEDKDRDAPKEVRVMEETSLGRNYECGIENIHLSRCQVSAIPIKGDSHRIRIKHMGKAPSFIIPRGSISETATRFADGAETFLNIGDKLSLLEGMYTYVLTKKVVRASSGGELKRKDSSSSSLSGSLERSASEMSELQDMVEYGLSLSQSSLSKKGKERAEGGGADASGEVAKQLRVYFPDRDLEVIKAASKLCEDASVAANMLLNKTDEEILGMSTDNYFAQLREIIGDGVDSAVIKEALAVCDFDIERATNKILADKSEAEQAKKYAKKDSDCLKKLREMYPDVDEEALRVAIEASGGDLAVASEFISADASVSSSRSPGFVERKKPRIIIDDDDDDGIDIIGVDSEWDKYASRDSVKLLKSKFPGVPEKRIIAVLRMCGEDVAFAEDTLKANVRPQSPQKPKSRPPPPPLEIAVDSDMTHEEMFIMLKSDPAIEFLDDETLKESLNATRNKSTDLAKQWIFADPDGKARLELEAKVLELKQMFPDIENKTLRETLAEHKGNVETTIGFLFGDPSSPKGPPADKSSALGLREDVDKDLFNQLRAMFPQKEERNILDALEASNNDIELATDFLVKEVLFANFNIYDTNHIDYGKEFQSAKGLGGKSVERFISPGKSKYIKQCFLTMLRREQVFHNDYFVFYHSYSISHIVYELNSILAPLAYHGISKNFPPLPRLLLGPFSGMPELSMLVERFKSMGSKDHDSEYRKLAISVSTSLFAPSSEAPPTTVFVTGYSCTDLNFRHLIQNTLKECMVPKARIEPLTNAVIGVGKKHGLEMSCYERAAGRLGLVAPLGGKNFGHMLQIFVHKEYVDEVAYSSLPYGVPTGKLLSDCLSRGDVNGQARIFMNPELFTDITKTRIFYYSSNEEFSHKREQLVSDLREVLKEVFDNAEMAQKAKNGIKGIQID